MFIFLSEIIIEAVKMLGFHASKNQLNLSVVKFAKLGTMFDSSVYNFDKELLASIMFIPKSVYKSTTQLANACSFSDPNICSI